MSSIPLTCKGCGATWEHQLCGCEPEGATTMESDICASCNTPGVRQNAIVTYFDKDGTEIETSEFKGHNHRH